jgi:hypothetical protein
MSRLGEHPNFAKKVFSGTHQRPIYHTSGQRDLFITQAGNATYLSHKRATRPIYHTSGQRDLFITQAGKMPALQLIGEFIY